MRFRIAVVAFCAFLTSGVQAEASTVSIHYTGIFTTPVGLNNLEQNYLESSSFGEGVADGRFGSIPGEPYSEFVSANATLFPGGNTLFLGRLYLEATGQGQLLGSVAGSVTGTLSGQAPGCTNSGGQFVQGYPVRLQWTTHGVVEPGATAQVMFQGQYWEANDPSTWTIVRDECYGVNFSASAGLVVSRVTGGAADFASTFTEQMFLPEGVTFAADTGQTITGGGSLAAVPEPASLTLLGLGLAGMAGRRWRQRKA